MVLKSRVDSQDLVSHGAVISSVPMASSDITITMSTPTVTKRIPYGTKIALSREVLCRRWIISDMSNYSSFGQVRIEGVQDYSWDDVVW